jgi:hypothetical protein
MAEQQATVSEEAGAAAIGALAGGSEAAGNNVGTDGAGSPPNPQQQDNAQEVDVDQQLMDAYNKSLEDAGGEGEATGGEPAPDQPAGEHQAGTEAKRGTEAPPDVVKLAKDMLSNLSSFKGKVDGMDDQAVIAAATERASNALKRWKWDADTIKALPADVLIERGTEAAQSQAEQDRLGNELSNFKRLQELAKQDDQQPKPDADGEPGKETGEPDAQGEQPPKAAVEPVKPGDLSAFQPIFDELKGSDYYDDLVEPLQKITSQLVSQMEQINAQVLSQAQNDYGKQLSEQQAYLSQLADYTAQQLDRIELGFVRDRYKGQLPELAKEEGWNTVHRKMVQLANLQGYRDESGDPKTDQLIRDAYRLEFGTNDQKRQQEQLLRRHRTQVDGQPDIPPAGGDSDAVPPAARSIDERLEAAGQMLQSGQDPEAVYKRLQSLNRQ